MILLALALSASSAAGTADAELPLATPTPRAMPTFVVPTGPEEIATVAPARIITGAAGGLVAGFGLGALTGILYYNHTRRRIPGLPSLSEPAIWSGARFGAYGAVVFCLTIGGYGAYTVPRRAPSGLPASLARDPSSPGSDGGPDGSAPNARLVPTDSAGKALAALESAAAGSNPPWISLFELEGDALVVRVSDDYDAVKEAGRRTALARILAAWNTARRAHALDEVSELIVKGSRFVSTFRPE